MSLPAISQKRSLLSLLQLVWLVLFAPAVMFGLANIAYALKTVLSESPPTLNPQNFEAYLEHYRLLNNSFLIVLTFSVAAYLFWKQPHDWMAIIASIGLFMVSIS